MREVKIHYFVPENAGELEGLVGKSVGVSQFDSITGQPLPTVTPMVLKTGYGKADEAVSREYEFLIQAADNSKGRLQPKRKILGYIVASTSLKFDQEGVLIPSKSDVVDYTPRLKVYKEVLQLLNDNNQWREPK